MTQDIVNVVDAGALALLAQSDNLDLLLANGRQAVITKEVLDEVNRTPSRPNSIKIRQWVDENKASGKVLTGYEPISDLDKARYNPPQPNGDIKPGQEGDVSIKKYIDSSSNSDKIYNIISNDNDLIEFKGNVAGYAYKGNFYSSESTYGFVNELMLDKKIDADQYLLAIQKLNGSPNAGQISAKYKAQFNAHEVQKFLDNDFIKPGNFTQNLAENASHTPDIGSSGFRKFFTVGAVAVAAEVLRQAGTLGDILSFGVTAAQAADLRAHNNVPAANEVWTSYIFETAGGLAGGIIGGGLGLRFGGFWGAVIGSVAGGAGGSYGGAALGGALYRAHPEIFDPAFDFIYDKIDELEVAGVSASHAFTMAALSSLGFDLTAANGSEGNDWMVASTWGERKGNGGDDLLIGWQPDYIHRGQPVDPANPDSAIATQDLRLTLDGGAGDDWVIALGGTGAITIGGEGRDWIFNTSAYGQLYGDTISGTDEQGNALAQDAANSDVFWYWPGTFIMDAAPNDYLITVKRQAA
jgi:hypothetical protein